MKIWILSHGYDYGDVYDKYKWNEEARFLGAYYTREEGLKALEKYKKIKGFCSHLDGFWLEKDKAKEKHRILSVCLSKLEARKKIKEYQKIEGFSSHISNFYIEEYILDKEIKKEGEL